MSKGHAALALYSILYNLNYSKNFNTEKFNKYPSLLTEHPQLNTKLPGIEFESGSLGNGMGVGSGIAYANKLMKKKSKTIISSEIVYNLSDRIEIHSNTTFQNYDQNLFSDLEDSDNSSFATYLSLKYKIINTEKWKLVFVGDGEHYNRLILKVNK